MSFETFNFVVFLHNAMYTTKPKKKIVSPTMHQIFCKLVPQSRLFIFTQVWQLVFKISHKLTHQRTQIVVLFELKDRRLVCKYASLLPNFLFLERCHLTFLNSLFSCSMFSTKPNSGDAICQHVRSF